MVNDNKTMYKDDDNTTSAPKVVVTDSDKVKTSNRVKEGKEKLIQDDDVDYQAALNPKDSYEGRKHQPNIDGPEQASQETDEVYSDPRQEENLPAGGKKVDELSVDNLGRK